MSRTKTMWIEDCKLYKLRSGYGMNFVCCDCGLVHRMFLQPAGRGWMNFMVLRDKRRTAARRRGKALRRTIDSLLTGDAK